MSMEQVAEIGYFVIKYIEELKLDHTVGLADKRPHRFGIYLTNMKRMIKKKLLVTMID
jgi:hypothetical protein